MSHAETAAAGSLEPYWMPFTANRQFKANPRMLVAAQGVHYTSEDGRDILDGVSGLWCVNLGHSPPHLVEALTKQLHTLDFAPAFSMGHPAAFRLAERLANIAPGNLDHVFFTNSGSEAVDTALKIALAYQKARKEGSRFRLIGRERGYHGVGFGGTSVGGVVKNRMQFGPLVAGVDHLPHTHDLEHNAFSRGQPQWGAHLADALENLVALHDASTIAAVIIEPMAGSTGVLIPPVGYLEKIREICTRHGIVLIFDEVITGFGRMGDAFASNLFGVTPDIITCAKGITNGTIPLGGVIVSSDIYQTCTQSVPHGIELFHGYTYSGHPIAMAAGLACLDIYEEKHLFKQAARIGPVWEEAVHSLHGLPHVIDIRNMGLVAAIELSPRPGSPGARGMEAFVKSYEAGILVRASGDAICLSPPLIYTAAHIERLITTLRHVLKSVD